MLRILFKGIYKKPRELHWVPGATLLVLTLTLCYTGTLLPANNILDQGSSTVSTRGFGVVYALHIACIPLLMSAFMGFHFMMVRRTGISEPL
jgi:quinol-cytochrome oxidoreductase complex cytochrome b subunit